MIANALRAAAKPSVVRRTFVAARSVHSLALPVRNVQLLQRQNVCLTQNAIMANRVTVARAFSDLSNPEIRSKALDFQDNFVEARMCLEDTQDSFGTVYFEDDLEEAQEAVKVAVESFEDVIALMDENAAGAFRRENGMKVEQLKGELEAILTTLREE
mmetsp:Transcript_7211/g.14441  ORF Transcript_7211/g.14441 Transcript_7211/m.14441 type:complete len:158 (+) Transcript_7211:103-576(+)